MTLTTERDVLLNAVDTLKLELRRELAHGHRQAAAAAGAGPSTSTGGSAKQDQLSIHKRRSSKASSFASVSAIPGIGAAAHHGRDPSSFSSGAAGRQPLQQQQQQQEQGKQHKAPGRRYSSKTVVLVSIAAFALGRWM